MDLIVVRDLIVKCLIIKGFIKFIHKTKPLSNIQLLLTYIYLLYSSNCNFLGYKSVVFHGFCNAWPQRSTPVLDCALTNEWQIGTVVHGAPWFP